jgi:flagellar basal body P-ring formation protein FlgA
MKLCSRLIELGTLAALALVITFAFAFSVRAETVVMLVPSRIIFPGEKLAPSDFIEKPFLVTETGAKKYLVSRQQIDGLEAARLLNAGKPVAMIYTRNSSAVRKGELAKAQLISSGILIEAQLVALEDGAVGHQIRVRYPVTGQKLLARVRHDGTLVIMKP